MLSPTVDGAQRSYRIIIKGVQRYHVHTAFDIPNIVIGKGIIRLAKFFKWKGRLRVIMYL